MSSRSLAIRALLFLCALGPLHAAPGPAPLVVGWHDEFTRSLGDWKPFPGGGADVSRRRRGVLTLTLGPGAASDPRTFAWAGVSRVVDVNLDEYPVLAVRVVRLSRDCWWDAVVQPVGPGAPEVKTDSLPERGLLLFDVRARVGPTGDRQRLRLRLNVAGLRRGGSVDYAWVRFIRREDAERLRRQPDLQNTLLAP